MAKKKASPKKKQAIERDLTEVFHKNNLVNDDERNSSDLQINNSRKGLFEGMPSPPTGPDSPNKEIYVTGDEEENKGEDQTDDTCSVESDLVFIGGIFSAQAQNTHPDKALFDKFKNNYKTNNTTYARRRKKWEEYLDNKEITNNIEIKEEPPDFDLEQLPEYDVPFDKQRLLTDFESEEEFSSEEENENGDSSAESNFDDMESFLRPDVAKTDGALTVFTTFDCSFTEFNECIFGKNIKGPLESIATALTKKLARDNLINLSGKRNSYLKEIVFNSVNSESSDNEEKGGHATKNIDELENKVRQPKVEICKLPKNVTETVNLRKDSRIKDWIKTVDEHVFQEYCSVGSPTKKSAEVEYETNTIEIDKTPGIKKIANKTNSKQNKNNVKSNSASKNRHETEPDESQPKPRRKPGPKSKTRPHENDNSDTSVKHDAHTSDLSKPLTPFRGKRAKPIRPILALDDTLEGEEIEGLTLCFVDGDIVPVRRSKRVAVDKNSPQTNVRNRSVTPTEQENLSQSRGSQGYSESITDNKELNTQKQKNVNNSNEKVDESEPLLRPEPSASCPDIINNLKITNDLKDELGRVSEKPKEETKDILGHNSKDDHKENSREIDLLGVDSADLMNNDISKANEFNKKSMCITESTGNVAGTLSSKIVDTPIMPTNSMLHEMGEGDHSVETPEHLNISISPSLECIRSDQKAIPRSLVNIEFNSDSNDQVHEDKQEEVFKRPQRKSKIDAAFKINELHKSMSQGVNSIKSKDSEKNLKESSLKHRLRSSSISKLMDKNRDNKNISEQSDSSENIYPETNNEVNYGEKENEQNSASTDESLAMCQKRVSTENIVIDEQVRSPIHHKKVDSETERNRLHKTETLTNASEGCDLSMHFEEKGNLKFAEVETFEVTKQPQETEIAEKIHEVITLGKIEKEGGLVIPGNAGKVDDWFTPGTAEKVGEHVAPGNAEKLGELVTQGNIDERVTPGNDEKVGALVTPGNAEEDLYSDDDSPVKKYKRLKEFPKNSDVLRQTIISDNDQLHDKLVDDRSPQSVNGQIFSLPLKVTSSNTLPNNKAPCRDPRLRARQMSREEELKLLSSRKFEPSPMQGSSRVQQNEVGNIRDIVSPNQENTDCRKKVKKDIDRELLYKTPLSDLHSETETRPSYNRLIPRKKSSPLPHSSTRDPRQAKPLLLTEKDKIAYELEKQLLEEKEMFKLTYKQTMEVQLHCGKIVNDNFNGNSENYIKTMLVHSSDFLSPQQMELSPTLVEAPAILNRYPTNIPFGGIPLTSARFPAETFQPPYPQEEKGNNVISQNHLMNQMEVSTKHPTLLSRGLPFQNSDDTPLQCGNILPSSFPLSPTPSHHPLTNHSIQLGCTQLPPDLPMAKLDQLTSVPKELFVDAPPLHIVKEVIVDNQPALPTPSQCKQILNQPSCMSYTAGVSNNKKAQEPEVPSFKNDSFVKPKPTFTDPTHTRALSNYDQFETERCFGPKAFPANRMFKNVNHDLDREPKEVHRDSGRSEDRSKGFGRKEEYRNKWDGDFHRRERMYHRRDDDRFRRPDRSYERGNAREHDSRFRGNPQRKSPASSFTHQRDLSPFSRRAGRDASWNEMRGDSPIHSRNRSRSRSPIARSPVYRRRTRSRSRSPFYRRGHRSRSRSPVDYYHRPSSPLYYQREKYKSYQRD